MEYFVISLYRHHRAFFNLSSILNIHLFCWIHRVSCFVATWLILISPKLKFMLSVPGCCVFWYASSVSNTETEHQNSVAGHPVVMSAPKCSLWRYCKDLLESYIAISLRCWVLVLTFTLFISAFNLLCDFSPLVIIICGHTFFAVLIPKAFWCIHNGL